jgi:Na+-translocating ferredoxin:NAD+ oxidoreductase RnfD subunit
VKIQKWIKTPKGYVTIALVSYLIIASIGSKNVMGITNSIIAICASYIVDFLYCTLMERKSSRDSTVITSLIISLILGFTTSWVDVAGTAAIAILSKHLIVYKKKPIFNPATVGLLLSIFIFKSGQSWWGAFGDLPAWTIIFLVIGGYLITDRVNKFPQVLSFLGTFFVLLFVMGLLNVGNAADAFRPPFINATLFFAFFMLTDPPTSPAKNKNQVLFGILSAVTGVLVYGMFGGLTYLFIGLCIGNLYSYLHKRSTSKVAAHKQNLKSTQQTRVGRASRASR